MAIINGIPLINGTSYTWGDIVCTIAGVPVTGITAIDYSDSQEVQNNYGAGRHPVSRGKGRITPSAKITLKMEEVLAIQSQSLNRRLQDLAAFDIIVTYLPANGMIVQDVIHRCQFKDNKRTWKEGDMDQSVEFELLPAYIRWGRPVVK